MRLPSKVKQEFFAKEEARGAKQTLPKFNPNLEKRRKLPSGCTSACGACRWAGLLCSPPFPPKALFPTWRKQLCHPTHYKRAPFVASGSVISVARVFRGGSAAISREHAPARVPSAAVAVKDLRPLRGAHRTRVLDRHPRCGCWLIMRSISASQFSNENGRAKKECLDG
jgi:hypothetical protein